MKHIATPPNHSLSVLKAMAAKGIKQRHISLLYQSVDLSVIDNGLGITIMAQKKPAKAGQSAERGNASHTGNHEGHAY